MTGQEHTDNPNRCCEGGNFGEPHDCRKFPSTPGVHEVTYGSAVERPTLRDQFAMAALTGFMAAAVMPGRELIVGPRDCKSMYAVADYMLEARKPK